VEVVKEKSFVGILPKYNLDLTIHFNNIVIYIMILK